MGVNPGQDFFVLEGFCDVIDRAQLEALDLVHGLGESGHEDHRDLPQVVAGLEPSAGFEAIEVRHEDEEEDEVWPHVLGTLQGASPSSATRTS